MTKLRVLCIAQRRMLPCTSRCWVHPCLLTWGGPSPLLLCSASFLPTFTTSSPSRELRGSSEATHGLSCWVPRASHPAWFGAAGVFAGRAASWGRRAGADCCRHAASSVLLIGKWHLNGRFLPVKTLADARARGRAFVCASCLLQQCCPGGSAVAGFSGKFSFPLFTFLLAKEELLSGRLQVHRYLLLIRLPFFRIINEHTCF